MFRVNQTLLTLFGSLIFCFHFSYCQVQTDSNLSWQGLTEYTRIKAREDIRSSLSFGYFDAFPIYLGLNRDTTYKFIFNADVNPHFLFRDQNTKNRLIFDFNPRIIGRIRQDESGPVKTPSFMPGLNIYCRIRHESINDPCPNISDSLELITCFNLNKDFLFSKAKTSYLSFGYRHHSNGQDQNAYTNEYDSLELVHGLNAKDYLSDNSYIFNRENGNFSTNMLTAGTNYVIEKRGSRWLWWKDITLRRHETFQIEAHPLALAQKTSKTEFINQVLGYDPKYDFRYPFLRLNCFMQWSVLTNPSQPSHFPSNTPIFASEVFRLSTWGSIVLNNLDGIIEHWTQRLSGAITANFNSKGNTNAGFFVTMQVQGLDTYNVYVEDSFFTIKGGVSTGLLGHNYRNTKY